MTKITDVVDLEKQGEIAVLMINNPPVNALSVGVRKGMAEGVKAAMEDDSVKALVIACAGRTFIAGYDITEFGKPLLEPGLEIAFDLIENGQKPVIAAIHGTALGGGLETALVCHFRVAVLSARFGLPEVLLGLLPGGGGTQRLPLVVGPEKAIQMIATGNQISAQEALKHIRPGQRVFIGSSCAEPLHLVKELSAISARLTDLEIVRLLSIENGPLTLIANEPHSQQFNIRSFYLGFQV